MNTSLWLFLVAAGDQTLQQESRERFVNDTTSRRSGYFRTVRSATKSPRGYVSWAPVVLFDDISGCLRQSFLLPQDSQVKDLS